MAETGKHPLEGRVLSAPGAQRPPVGSAGAGRSAESGRVGPIFSIHFTRFVSPLYRLAVSDPFERDIRAARVRSPRVSRPRAPVLHLADRPLGEQILLILHYEGY